ncbi:glycosyltransferase [Aurantiacibacter gangjinensis]|uniref:glycosyltransferase n=1 Tax=Aurantiacibacter gangjinensis TaxID=502682 RepID=UPI00069963BC|nr:glycosyltransferase [Aurantiacibacter gangjinensis]APE29150.1 Glycosyl transferase, group 1 [Aurantiacibacter gangjinensis]
MTTGEKTDMRIVMLGTYDLGKPRTRLLRRALREISPAVREIHFDVWRGVEDKSVLDGFAGRLRIVMRMLVAYPMLAVRYLMAGRHDVVVIGYMGLFDMLLLAPLAKLRGKRVVWDAFLSIYDTYARDRGLGRETGFKAQMLRCAERQACRLADMVVLDTQAHAALMGELHAVPISKLGAVMVGAEEGAFGLLPSRRCDPGRPPKVLFYGQFIPLHGIATIVEAALSDRGRTFEWRIIGQGQEAERIDAILANADAPHIKRIGWVDYSKLQDEMADADICLGIFGTSDKASRVIPNKVYQALQAGKVLVTRDSPAMRELVSDSAPGLHLCEAGSPAALLDALETAAGETTDAPLHRRLAERFAFPALVEQWRGVLQKANAR